MAIAVALSACEEDPAPSGEDGGTSAEESGGATEGETEGIDLQPGANVCLAAAPTGAGVWTGELRGKESNNGGACELGGPDVFFNIEVPRRADVSFHARANNFEPRVGVRHSDCAVGFDERGVLCTTGLPGWVYDVAGGTTLIASVGIDPAAPVLQGRGGLGFELEVAFRPVLAAGEGCQPDSVGRCESGTLCIAESDAFGTPIAPAECVPIDGDTCQSAFALTIPPGETRVGIPRQAIQTDAHLHSCMGARTRERVFRVELDGNLGEGARVGMIGETVAGYAVRGPGCLLEEELGCVEGGGTGTGTGTLVVDSPPPSFYLFVELTEEASDPGGEEGRPGEEAPHVLTILFEEG